MGFWDSAWNCVVRAAEKTAKIVKETAVVAIGAVAGAVTGATFGAIAGFAVAGPVGAVVGAVGGAVEGAPVGAAGAVVLTFTAMLALECASSMLGLGPNNNGGDDGSSDGPDRPAAGGAGTCGGKDKQCGSGLQIARQQTKTSTFDVNLDSPFITPDELAELIRRVAPAHAAEDILRNHRKKRFCTKCGQLLRMLCMLCDNSGATCWNPAHCPHSPCALPPPTAQFCTECGLAVHMHALCLACDSSGIICANPAHCPHSRRAPLALPAPDAPSIAHQLPPNSPRVSEPDSSLDVSSFLLSNLSLSDSDDE